MTCSSGVAALLRKGRSRVALAVERRLGSTELSRETVLTPATTSCRAGPSQTREQGLLKRQR